MNSIHFWWFSHRD